MAKSPNALELLRRDHREVLQLMRRFERSDDPRELRELCADIVADLDAHTTLEEDVFYPYVREATDRLDLIEEATIEHGSAKELMQALRDEDPQTPRFRALMKVLTEYVALHVREEEERIFPVVERLGIDLEALGLELAEHRDGSADGGKASAGRGHGRSEGRQRDHAAGSRAARHGNGGAREGRGNGSGRRDQGGAGGTDGGAATDTTRDDRRYLKEHGDELSRSTQHALWIHHPDQHADHDGQTLATRNPAVIRRWAEERGGRPATIPGADVENPRVLRIDFPEYDERLQAVSWDAWFKVFQDRELVFLFQETMKAGNPSNFFRLDSPGREDG